MLKVGFYEKEITPPLGDDIPGYAGPRRSTTIHDPLRAKAVSVKTGDAPHECVIMVTVDLIGVHDRMYDVVMEKVEKWTGVPQKNIMIAATHTHTGGPIRFNREFREGDEMWLEVASQSAADAAIMAYQRMTDAKASYNTTTVEGLSFCRDYHMKDGSIRTNPGWHNPNIVKPAGTTDPEFNVMFFHDADGNAIGAISNYSCHHDSKAGTEVSADYSGVLADKMKDVFGRNFVNVFFQGCCGNINHVNPFREKLKYDIPKYIEIGTALAKAEEEMYKTAKDVEIDAVYGEKRVLPVRRREVPPEMVEEAEWIEKNVPIDWYQMNINNTEGMMFKRTHAYVVKALAQSPKYHPAYIQVIRLGEMSIYALPAEQYVEFGLYIKENSPTKYNMVSGTALKGIRGYVPTKELAGSESYAVVLGSSDLVPEAGQQMADKALEIANEIQAQADKTKK